MKSLPMFPHPRKSSLRLLTSGLIALQPAIVGTAVSEFIATQPQLSNTQVAYAQNSNVQAVEAATAYIQTDRGSGSGAMVDSSGLIVTNAHVLQGARQVKVSIQGRQFNASVVSMGHANCLDLALLRLEGNHNLPTVTLSDMNDIHKTQPVWAVGFPGLHISSMQSATITQGIISNLHPMNGLVQLDGPLNPGNSGGPVVDDEGSLVGIATKGEGNDTNYAVSVDRVAMFVEAYQQGINIPNNVMIGSHPDGDDLATTISLNSNNISGILQENDSRYCNDGSLVDLYTFDAEAGQSVMLNMVSPTMGSYLELLGPNGELTRSNVQEQNQSATILTNLSQTGTYTVLANAARHGQSGNYQLRVTQPLLVKDDAVDISTAPCSNDGQRCQTYKFLGSAEQDIMLFLSAEFNPYIVLLSPTGEVVANGSTDSQARINFALESDGWYTLMVGTMNPEEFGRFGLSIHDARALNSGNEVARH